MTVVPETDVAVESEDKAARTPLWELAGGWGGVGVALWIFIATRILQLLALEWLMHDSTDRRDLFGRLTAWDSGWFVRVATEGYPQGFSYNDHGALDGNGLAFFPLYPLSIRVVSAITMLEAPVAGLVVSWIAAAAAAVVLYLLGTSLANRKVGWALVVLCFAQPMSVVLVMAYSEPMFIAFVAGTLVAAHRRSWAVAGLCGLGASLTRPNGAAVALALALAVALAFRGADRAERWRAGAAALVALAGVPAYLGWVALRAGDLTAWFKIQTAGWGTSLDGGVNTLRFLDDTLSHDGSWVAVSTAFLLITATVAIVVAIVRRPWPPLVLYGLVAFVLVVCQSGFYHSKIRLLVPVLLLLLPAAYTAARARPRTAVAGLVAYALFGVWYGAHMLVVWPYTI